MLRYKSFIPVQIIQVMKIIQHSAISMYHKSRNKVQFIQCSSNHSTKYKPFNRVVQIIQHYGNLSMEHAKVRSESK